MLRALDPNETPPPSAYLVPWSVDRTAEAHPVVTNVSRDALDFVRVFIDHPRYRTETELWGQMISGDQAHLCLCHLDPAETVVTIAWFRPVTGDEYVWRFTV